LLCVQCFAPRRPAWLACGYQGGGGQEPQPDSAKAKARTSYVQAPSEYGQLVLLGSVVPGTPVVEDAVAQRSNDSVVRCHDAKDDSPGWWMGLGKGLLSVWAVADTLCQTPQPRTGHSREPGAYD